MSKKTPLYAEHAALGAKMVEFAGWEMPQNYGSQLEEHAFVRDDAGMFDVSHMVITDILGAGGRDFLRHLLTNDVDKIKTVGGALYSCMLNHDGGVIDDCIVYFLDVGHYRLISNAGTAERVTPWLNEQSVGFSVGLQVRHDLAIVAVQGPNAIAKCAAALPSELTAGIQTLKPFHTLVSDYFFIARTGYTGEEGLEIVLPSDKVVSFWRELIKQGIKPCGLGSRDTLRLEAGYNLSGTDMDETVTPLVSNLGWTVAWRPEDRLFIGRATLEIKQSQGVKRKLVGLVLEGKGIMRHGQAVKVDDDESGSITSGTYSPTLRCSIAMARVPITIGEQCLVKIRKEWVSARVIKPSFVRKGKKQF